MTSILELRKEYHAKICSSILRKVLDKNGNWYINNADCSNPSSVAISKSIVEKFPYETSDSIVKSQTAGDLFEKCTKQFIENSFSLLDHIRPGRWVHSTTLNYISQFDQYNHLGELDKLIQSNKTLSTIIGSEYIIRPDITISRAPLDDTEINKTSEIVSEKYSIHSPLRKTNNSGGVPILHASISCKWSIRSDRSQNTRTEALNLIRNRKGNLPHIVCVTAEPLPTRIATLALGTGDLDCVYHFALNELISSVEELNNHDQFDILQTMVEGRRLRDISDLPLDLAV
jgi:hypothetical protein